jgi:glycosyltransferase involved in cell wall biosynthesis
MAESAHAALRGGGNEVRVLTTRPDPSERQGTQATDPDVHRDLRWYWCDHRFPPIGLRAAAALERENARALERHLGAFRPEVVLWWAMGGMSLSLFEQVRHHGVPAVGVVGDDWIGYGPAVDGWTRRWRGRRASLAPVAQRLVGVPARVDLAAAARWIFISEHLRSRAGLHGIVLHPGVDPERFAFHPPHGWHWRLLCCGRIDPRKGIATAIEALAHLPANATLTIDGQGEQTHGAELLALSRRLGLADRVELRSSASGDVPAAYAGADALIFPVVWEEPWGLVPLEAMATGCPVVASSAGGGAAEYLRDGRNCLTFPPRNATAVAGALRRVAEDPQLRERLIAGGAQTAASFTAERFHAALAEELERTAAGDIRSLG